MNKKKIGTIAMVILLIAVAGIYIGINCWKNRKIEFADENMAKVICGSVYGYGGDVTPENITWEELDSIEILDIGYTGYYSTIKDIEKCKNLQRLYINNMLREDDAAYQIANGEIEKDLSIKDVEKLEKELAQVLPELPKLKEMRLADLGNCEWTSIDFLRGCNHLEELRLYSSKASDYSVLKECKLLKSVTLWKCNISSAKDIIGIENVEHIGLSDTPLDQNPTEVQKLRDAYPNVDIDIKKPSKKK